MAKRIFHKERGVLSTAGATSATFDIPIPNNTSTGFVAKIVARETTLNIGAMSQQVGSISNNGGTVTMDGAVVSLGAIVNAGLAGITSVFTANSTNLRLTVTGVVLLNVDWEYEIEVIHN